MSNRPLILLVEDKGVNQLLTSGVREGEGFAVDIADTSVEALEMLRSRVPDLILMDIQLPGLDGLSFARTLKADPSTEPIPIVALTAHAMNGDREQSLAAGCVGYISKPIDTRTFGQQVRAFISSGMPASGPARTAAILSGQ